MKKYWLRGMLLGVSLALLLSAGIALAQGSLAVNRGCVPCVPDSYWDTPFEVPLDPYALTVTGTGWPPNSELYHELRWPYAAPWTVSVLTDASGNFAFPVDIAFWCECPPDMDALAYGAAVSQDGIEVDCPESLGELEFYYSYDAQEASISVLLARVCEVPEEFVPEPGTIMLFGSGLMGLAGYATLRWRTRE